MLVDAVVLVLGFALLVKGADWFVGASSTLARAFGVSELVVGLTIVAFGTSAPELAVSLLAGLKGNPELSLGNVVGSNICNILLILGASALIRPLFAARGTVWQEAPFVLLAALVLMVQANDGYLDGAPSVISRGEGLTLLLFFAVFLGYIAQVITSLRGPIGEERPKLSAWRVPQLVAGLAMLIAGAHLSVGGAEGLALSMGVSERLVGLLVLAVGTSLPELVTSLVAASRGKNEIAVGNIVGSNIFNVFLILGVSSFAAPLPVAPELNGDMAVMVGATVLLLLAMHFGKPKHQIQRIEGGLFIASYAVYIGWLFWRG